MFARLTDALLVSALVVLAAACSSSDKTLTPTTPRGTATTAGTADAAPTTAPAAAPTHVPTTPPTEAATAPPPPPPTEPPPPPAATSAPPPAGNCSPSYPGVCIPPPPPDLDCPDIPFRRFRVIPPDPHRFDNDGDGIGCESG